jgi:hypothetical protein
MSTGGPFNSRAGRTGSTTHDDRGLLNKLKGAIKPLGRDNDENSPRNSAHRNGRDGGGSGDFGKPPAVAKYATGGASAKEQQQQQQQQQQQKPTTTSSTKDGEKKNSAPSIISPTVHGFQPGITGGHGTQGLNP